VKKTVKIPMDDAVNILAQHLVDKGELPMRTKVQVIAPTNGKSFIAFQWETE
jgi:antitoxin component of RelBE/YafQ-DinJ toxin-antitoxin module